MSASTNAGASAGASAGADTDVVFNYPFNIIYAGTKEHGIGYEGRLPWQGVAELSAAAKIDMRVFRELTKGAAVIMGLTTALSLPKGCLPGRTNYILTTKHDSTRAIGAADLVRFGANNVQTAALSAGLDAGLVMFAASIGELNAVFAAHYTGQPIFVIGGEVVYMKFKQFPTLNCIYRTILSTEQILPADTYFTTINNRECYYSKIRIYDNLSFAIYSNSKTMLVDRKHYFDIIKKYTEECPTE